MPQKSTISSSSEFKSFTRARLLKFALITGFFLFGCLIPAISQQVVTQTFTSSGTFTPPAGVTKVSVKAWGGGGGGGGADSNGTENRAGGGGAGGAYSEGTFTVVPLAGITVTVGAGGAGGNGTDTPQNGFPGGPSMFGALLTAPGGAGGALGNGTDRTGNGGITTVGGTQDGGAGAEAPPGGTATNATGSGGGGGSGGPGGVGGPASGITAGTAGAGGGGAGAAGLTGLPAGTSGDGNAATEVGGGGSGGWDNLDNDNTGNGAAGGDGFRGEVIVTYTLPTAAITYDDADGIVKAGQVVRITATFSEPIADAPVMQLSLSGANTLALTNMTKSSTTVYYYDHTVGAGNGAVTVALGTGSSANGNIVHPTPTSGATFTVDNTAPTFTSVTPVPSTGTAKIGDAIQINFTAAGSESNLVAGATLTVNGVNVAGTFTNLTGGNYRVTYTVGSGDTDRAAGALPISLDINDVAGNTTTINAFTAANTLAIDANAPTISIGAPSAALTTGGPITYTITYSGASTVNLVNGNVTLNTTGTATGTVAVTNGTTNTPTVTISGITGDGTLGISIAAGTASDAAGNTVAGAGPSTTFGVDNTPPGISIGAPSAANTNTGPVSYSITYTATSSVNLTTGDITLNTTGTATGTVSVTNGTTANPTVTINGITGDGTLGISIGAGTASDAAGNTAAASGASTTFNVDNTPPGISIGAPSATLTNSGPVSFLVTYTGTSSVNLTTGNITLNTTGTATGTVSVTNGTTSTPTVTINGIIGNGTLGISIAGGTGSDAAGNTTAAAGPSTTFSVDNAVPVFSATAPASSASVNHTRVDYTLSEAITSGTITWTEVGGPILDVTSPHVQTLIGTELNSGAHTNTTLTNNPTLVSGVVYDITFNGTDAAGNAATTVTRTNVTFDNTPPALADGEFTLNLNGGAAETITFALSETLNYADQANITGFSVNGFTVGTGNFATAKYTLAGNTITLTSTADGSWNTGATVSYTSGSASQVIDLAGNTMASVASTPVTVQVISLEAGDIAFTGFNSDPTSGGGDAIDGFSFVLLKDISINTTIKFTDNGWSGDGTPSLTTDESTITWVSSAAMQAGTEVTITETTDDNLTATHGTITSITGQTNFSLSDGGDQVLAYQGASSDPTFIAGIHNSNEGTEDGTLWNLITDVDGDNNRSGLPTGLTNGVNALSFSGGRNENTQYKTTGVTLTGSAQQLRASMNDVANWNRQDNTAYTLTNGVNKFPIRPVITAVSIPAPFNYVIGGPYTATMTVHDDRGSIHTGLSGNIGGFTLSGLTRTNSTTYTAQFSVTEGGTDVASGSGIPLSISLTSSQGNTITSVATPNTPVAYTTAISQANDPIDANSPTVMSINRNTTATPVNGSSTFGTSAASVVFRITFSEDMQNLTLTAADFSIPVTGSIAGAAVTNISAVTGTSVFDVTVGSYSGTGTIGLNYRDSEVNVTGASVLDLLGNATFASPGVPNGSVTGQTYSIVLPEPTNAPFAVTASNITGNSVTLTWSSSNVNTPIPTHFLVLAKLDAGAYPSVTDLNYVNDGPMVQNIVRAPGINTATFTGLSSGNTYDFRVYRYSLSANNSIDNINFETSAPGNADDVLTTIASVSAMTINFAPVTIESIKDTQGNSKAVMQFTIHDDGQDALSPNIMALHPNGYAQETITLTLRGELTLAEGASVTGFTSSTGVVASAIYTGKGSTNTITLTNGGANGTWISGTTTISYDATIGNVEFIDVNLGKMQPIAAHDLLTVADITVTYNTNGTFNVPAGITQLSVEVWGAGGSGGPVINTASYSGASSGGGGGAYSRRGLTVAPLTAYSVVVGTGGPAALGTVTYVQSGNNGGGSYFGNTSLVYAEGGQGGWNNDWTDYYGTTIHANTSTRHGLGGQATNGAGDVKFSGGDGGYGFDGGSIPGSNPGVFGSGGGGGSSAGTGSNGNMGGNGIFCVSCSTSGGAGPAGGGAGGLGMDGQAGIAGSFPGGGGGGTSRLGPFASGAGANGQVTVTYAGPHPVSGGTSAWADDNAPFKFSQLVITQGDDNSGGLSNWQDIIAGAELSDGTHTVTGAVNPTNLTFSNATDPDLDTDSDPDFDSDSSGDFGYIDDANATASTKNYTLKIWLRDNLSNTLATTVDGLNLDFKIDPANLTYDDISNSNQQSSRLNPTHPAIQSGANPVGVVATQLDFSTNPITNQLVNTNVTSVSAAPDNSTVPVIRARDANGNTDLDFDATISLSNTGTLLMSQSTVTMNNGRANFPAGFQYQGAGNGTLTASTSTNANSSPPAPPANGSSSPVTVDFAELSTMSVVSTGVISTNNFYAIPFIFSITDDGGPGGDGVPTQISQIKITKKGSANPIADWREILDITSVNGYGPAWLYDGSTTSYLNPTVTVNQNDITFSNMLATPNNLNVLGLIGDGQTKTFQLYIFFKPLFGGTLPSTVDDLNFDFEILPGDVQMDPLSSRISPAQLAISSGPIDVDVDAAQLRFTTQPPADVLVNADLTASPVVEAVDRILPSPSAPFYPYGNRDLDFTASPTITNTGTLGMTNMPSSFVDGSLAFPVNFRYTQTGNGQLTVNAAGVTGATSNNVNVRVGISGTITAGGGAEPGTISSLVDTNGEKIQVFDFTVADDAGVEDDGNPMLITQIRITQQGSPNNTITNWANAIAVAELFDGTNTLTGVVGTNDILFSAIPVTVGAAGHIADDGNKTYQLRIYLRSTLLGSLPTTIDGLAFGFEVLAANVLTSANGTSIIGTENENSGAANEVTVIATTLTFTNAQASYSINSNIVPALRVEARDANGNRDLDFTGPDTEITNFVVPVSVINAPQENDPLHVFTDGVYTFPSNFQYTAEIPSNNIDGNLTIDAGGNSLPSLNGGAIIDITSSAESILSFTTSPGFTYNSTLPYINYQDNSNMIPLAGFTLTDGNGSDDDDGAATSISSITFEVQTNGTPGSSDIRNLALFNNAGTLIVSQPLAGNTITFSGLSGITTGFDFSSPSYAPANFTVRASFNDTDTDVFDGDAIQLRITNVIMNGGSKLNPIGGVTGSDINASTGVVTNPPFTPNGVNIVDVIATRLDFITHPAAIEGINRLITEPEVRARDANGIVDVNHGYTGSISSATGLSNNSFPFVNGVMNLTGLQYTSAGDGTLTVSSNGLSSATGGSTPCNHVDVINVFTVIATNGVITSPNLPGGAVNRVIFGVTFNSPYDIAGEPKLNRFIINFTNPISGVLKNARVFESTNISYEGSDQNVESTSTIGATVTEGAQSITVDFTTGTPRDLSLPANSQLTYFLMVDVEPTASGSTPSITPFVVNNASNVFISNGSVYRITNTIGQSYTFASIFPPTLVSSYPASGQLNVDPNQPTIDLTFSVPVWTLDNEISLYDKETGLLVQKLTAVNGQYSGGAGTVANPISFSLPPLLTDHLYYITIPQGDEENLIGIMDESSNEFPGISYSGTLYFKTANQNPPILLNSSSSPPANDPTITNKSLSGATINATFDQKGTAYFMVVNSGDPVPTNAEILSGAYAGTVVDRGSFPINQVYPISQFGQIDADLTANSNYDVWIFAQNDALPTPKVTAAPYGGATSGFVVGGTDATLSFTAPPAAPPTGPITPIPQTDICVNSYQILNAPIIIVEQNNGDFMNAGVQTFNLLLPTGFQFDVTTINGNVNSDPVYGTLTLSGADFTAGSGTLRFINNSTLRVSYQNTTSTDRDVIVISGLRVLATSITSGSIRRLGGNALVSAMPDLTAVAEISSSNADPIEFTNSYSLAAFPLAPSPITVIPDDQGQIELIPDPDDGDYGPSIFTGPGVNVNKLNVGAVDKGAQFNITITHADNNGCVSQNPIQYTVYDHTAAIKGLSTDFCLKNSKFPNSAAYGASTLIQTVLFNNLTAYQMYNLEASIPFDASADQIINGTAWQNILQTLPFVTSSFPDVDNPSIIYKNYTIDGAKILNADSLSGGAIADPYSNFIEVTPQENTYYRGGSLGFVQFKGDYQSIANGSVQIPLIQNVEFFVPAIPVVEVPKTFTDVNDPDNIPGSGGPSNKGTPVFCVQGGNININGYPAASVGSSLGSFSLMNVDSVYMHVKDLTLGVATANSGGQTRIILNTPVRIPDMPVGFTIRVRGRNGAVIINSLHTITSQVSGNEYIINLPYNAANIINFIEYTLLLDGFTDNGNGTAILDPTKISNNFEDIRIIYTYQDNASPCRSSASQIIRIEPNPVAVMDFESIIGENTPVPTAYCEGKPISFDGRDSYISNGEITLYKWDFNDDVNADGSNLNQPEGGVGVADSLSHFYKQSALYNVELTVTSSYGCSSQTDIQPVAIGAIPTVKFDLTGVAVNEPFSFDIVTAGGNSIVNSAPAVNDGFEQMIWDYGDTNTDVVTSNFATPVTHPYSDPGVKIVTLEITSIIGCANDLQKDIVVLPKVTRTDTDPAYEASFEDGRGGDFQTWPQMSSWAYGIANSPVITSTSQVWKTNLTGSYLPTERSALYTACFDIDQLTRPIITFNSFKHLAPNSDGVVIEYSVDNLNITDINKQWITLGPLNQAISSGINWHNGSGLPSKPGKQPSGDYGWTGIDSLWRASKHSLAGIPIADRNNIVFRFALASVTSDANHPYNGFAIDDLRIGNGTRTVLVENFTNTGIKDQNLITKVQQENEEFRLFQENSVGVEVVKIQYHVGFPGTDPFNIENAADPGARALYYNISDVPRARMDGTFGTSPGPLFSDWGTPEFNKRVLDLANAEIYLSDPVVTAEGELTFTASFRPLIDLPGSTLLHIAILEEDVSVANNPALAGGRISTGETEFKYVLKKMLPNAAGTQYNNLLEDQITAPITFTWSNASLFNPVNDIAVVAFLQDENSRVIYQSVIKRNINDPSVVTGIEDLNTSFKVYPNPADRAMTIELPEVATESTPLQLFDQMGKVVHESTFEKGESRKTIDTDDFAAGVYLIQVESKNGMLRRKVMVMHRN